MKTWKYRSRRVVGTLLSLLFFLILFIRLRIFQRTDFDESDPNQTKYCDQKVIRQYFMNDQKYIQRK